MGVRDEGIPETCTKLDIYVFIMFTYVSYFEIVLARLTTA